LRLFLEDIVLNTQVWFFVFYLVRTILSVLMLAMTARAILSWIVMLTEGGLAARMYGFLQLITEPIIMPMRKLFDFFGWGEEMMIDLPFMLTFFVLMFFGSSFMII
jgi:uncharacterized protein YggT (Ycf19 family)